MPRSSKPRRPSAARGQTRRAIRTGPRKIDIHQASPALGLHRRGQRFGNGRPPRLPGRTGGR